MSKESQFHSVTMGKNLHLISGAHLGVRCQLILLKKDNSVLTHYAHSTQPGFYCYLSTLPLDISTAINSANQFFHGH